MSYPPSYPHDPIEEIAADVFMVRGSVPLNRLMRISRNMAIIRHQGELSLINPMRLSDQEEARLKELGQIKRLVRLGPMHGMDDPYYVDTFAAELWSQAGGTMYTVPPIDVTLSEETELPFPGAKLFCFHDCVQPESCLLLDRGAGLLLTCDGIQHYGDYSHNTFLARTMMPFIGFPKTTIIGPFWLKLQTPDGGSLKADFERLLALDFDGLLSAHGTYLTTGAHAAVKAAVDRSFS